MDVLEVVTLNDLSSKEFVLDKTEDLSLLVFNTITCECEFKRKFDSRECNSDQKWNSSKCRCEGKVLKEHHLWEKDCSWNPAKCSCKNVTDGLVITCDEIINTVKIDPTNIYPKKKTKKLCKTKDFYILIIFLWITAALLIAASVHCYLIKY